MSNPGSSNGRTAEFGSANRGSNPCPGTTPMTAAEKAWSIKWMADKNEPLWRISEAARMLAMQLDEANHD